MIQVPKRIRPPTNCDPLLQTASGMGDVADFAKMAAALAQAKRFSNPIGTWSTGLEDLDRRDVALRSGALTIILGPSGVGSTILATGFVRTAARENARIGVVCVNEPMLHFVERFARSSMRRVANTLTADDLAFLSIATTELDIKVVESQPSVSLRAENGDHITG